MPENIDQAFDDLNREANVKIVLAFKQSVQLAGGLAADICPVGHYGATRGKAGKSGGDLKLSLHADYLGESGGELQASFGSPLPYAAAQHDNEYFHPGLYTGRPGDKYVSAFFLRATDMVFKGVADPLGRYTGQLPATFQELLDE